MPAYVRLVRPFTLMPPMLGMLTGALAAYGSGKGVGYEGTIWTVLIGCAMAATLNAASNVVNQIFDLEQDRINKPHRPLPAGEVSMRGAAIYTVFLYVAANVMAWFIDVGSGKECFYIVLFTSFVTYAYSGRPFRWRRFGWRANLTIALPRGLLLKVAGWSCVAPVFSDVEPWFLGTVFFFFLLGAATTKDYGDMAGDRAEGVHTLPVRLGPARAIAVTAPFFWLPWLLLPAAALTGIMTAPSWALTTLGVGLAAYGFWMVALLKRDPEALVTSGENHPAWRHMYLLMMVAQLGSAAVYQFS